MIAFKVPEAVLDPAQNPRPERKQRSKTVGENGERIKKANRCGWGNGMGFGFMRMVRAFIDKQGGDADCKKMKKLFMHTMRNGTEEEKKAQWEMFGAKMIAFGEHANVWKSEFGEDWGVEKAKRPKNANRAKLISQHGEVLELIPGNTNIQEIEILNNTNVAWKTGCTLSLADEQAFDMRPIDEIIIPVEQEVKGKSSLKLHVPLTALANVKFDSNQTYTLNFTFRGPKGQAFGEIIPILVKVNPTTTQTQKTATQPQMDQYEVAVYKLAIKLHEMNLGSLAEC